MAEWATHNGNTTDDQSRTPAYDAWNRLVAVLDQYGILQKAYVYDGLNRRVTETDGWASTDLYYSASWQVLEERKGVTTAIGQSASSNGFAAARYLFSPVYVNAPILRDRDADNDGSHTLEERLVFTCDANFNITAILNSGGSVQQRLLYQAYGEMIITGSDWQGQFANTLALRQGFQGGWQDLNTGLINFQMRDYNPRTMTWNTQDPLGFVDGMNRYEFCRSTPVNLIDPNGTTVTDAWDKFRGRRVKKAYGLNAGGLAQLKSWGLPGLQVGAQSAIIFFADSCEVAAFSVATGAAQAIRDLDPGTVFGKPFEGGAQVGIGGGGELATKSGVGAADASSFQEDFHTVQGTANVPIPTPVGPVPLALGASLYWGDPDALGGRWWGGTASVGPPIPVTPPAGAGTIDWNYKLLGNPLKFRVYMNQLRQKPEDNPSQPRYLITEPGRRLPPLRHPWLPTAIELQK